MDADSEKSPDPLAGVPSLQELAGRNYLTLEKAAVLIGCRYQTALKYIKETPDGKPPRLRAYRVGKQWRIDETEMRRFLAGL